MATASQNLWGELEVGEVRTPVAILREQTALLGPLTKNRVEAVVETQTFSTSFYHSFLLVVPALDGYQYELFRLSHEIDPYPIALVHGKGLLAKSILTFDSEPEFVRWLKNTLSSDETKRTLRNLIAHATR